MHGQGNYSTPVGQGSHAPPSVFQQRPVGATNQPTFHHGPLAAQPQFCQQGRPSFHLTPGMAAYHQSQPSAAQSYLNNPQAQAVNLGTQISHSYPTSERQTQPWNQNVHQLPPPAPHMAPNAYSLPSTQRPTIERGPPHQPTSHAPPPPMPPYSSSSSFSTSDPSGTSLLSVQQHPYLHAMGPLPPPPALPLPPPPPFSSPPGAPPLPPSSPPSDNLSKNDGSRGLKENLLHGYDVTLECPPPVKPVEDRSVNQIEVSRQYTEKDGSKVESVDAIVAHSPADSDMDMEDDITQPDEEKLNCLSANLNDERISASQEDYAKEQQQALQRTTFFKVALDGNLLSAESSVSEERRGGSEVPPDCDITVTRKVYSEADKSCMTDNRQIEHMSDVSLKESVSQHEKSSEPVAPVRSAETFGENLSDQQIEGANPFKLLQGYASDNNSESEGESLPGDVCTPSTKVGPTDSDADKVCDFGSELRIESLSKSNEHISGKSMTESAMTAKEADKMPFTSGKVEESSDNRHRDQESVSIGIHTEHQQKQAKRHSDSKIGVEGSNFQNPDMKSNSATQNVDEFGRLVREGVSDSETSDSPDYTRRHARRARRLSRSQSRSRSPHDRRSRSPRRRKERRGRSRSLTPKRRRSRSRSPVSRRGSDFFSDKLRREKGPVAECFDFLRGRCYRGATCRYSHHETGKNERLRYSRGKLEIRDKPPSLRSPDLDKVGKLHPEKEVKNKELQLPQDVPGWEEVKDAVEPPVDPTTNTAGKLGGLESASLLVADATASNLSHYPAQDQPSGKENSLIRESAAQYHDKIPQIVDQQGKRMDTSLVSESSNKSEVKQDPTGPLHSFENSIAKSHSSEQVPSQSLKELSPATANHHQPHLPLPLPPVSQVMSASFAQDYKSVPYIAPFHSTPGNYTSYQAPLSYQHSHFPGPSNPLPSSFLPPPPPLPQSQHNIPSQHMHQPLLPPGNDLSSYTSTSAHPTEFRNQSQTGQYQAYPSARESDRRPPMTDDFVSNSLHVSNLPSQQSGIHVMGDDNITGNPKLRRIPISSLPQAQPNSLLMQSPLKPMSLGGSFASDSNPSYTRPYFQQAPYGLQYSAADSVSAQLAEPGKVSSSMSRVTPDFLQSQPSYVNDFVGSRISNHFNPYASTFDLPLTKFSSNAIIQENNAPINSKYGVPFGLSSVPVDGQKIGSIDLKNMVSSSTLPRPGGNQYDPLFDSIEPASDSFSRADLQKYEHTGDSDNILKLNGSRRVLDMEDMKREADTAVSANDSIKNEEYGETADAEVGAVLNGSPSNPNDAADMNAGEMEIDQVKSSGKKKKGKDSRSMKLFKVSIATFVKEVLKPSWRQGNMSKEAFKTIVKKTVDKVSGAMKSHRIPKSQAKINHYIDSSRGKLTKLVMGYVDKYVKA